MMEIIDKLKDVLTDLEGVQGDLQAPAQIAADEIRRVILFLDDQADKACRQ